MSSVLVGLGVAISPVPAVAVVAAEPEPTQPPVTEAAEAEQDEFAIDASAEEPPSEETTPEPESAPTETADRSAGYESQHVPDQASGLQAAPSAVAGDCIAAPLGVWGGPLTTVEMPTDDVACLLVTTTNAGTYVLRGAASAAAYPSFEIYEADDTFLGGFRVVDTVTMTLKASHQYQILISNGSTPTTASFGMFRVADGTGCDSIASTAWDASATSLPFQNGTEVTCREITAATGDRVRISTEPSLTMERVVLNAAGNVVCSTAWSSNVSDCVLTGTGPWRLVQWVNTYYSPDPPAALDLWVNNYSITDGCATGSLATWGQVLPVTGERSSRPADCVVVTTSAAGSYLARLENGSLQWQPGVEIREVSGAHIASIGSRTWLNQLPLKASHAYRFIVTGSPDGYAADYTLGLYRLADDTACAPIASTAWDSAASTLNFPNRTEVNCRRVSATSGDRIRMTSDLANGYLEHEVYNAAGSQVCNSNSGGDLNTCQLSGTGPWRVVSYFHTGHDPDPASSVDLWVNNYGVTTGCATASLATWGQSLPVTGERGSAPADCVVVTTSAAGNYLARLENSSPHWSAAVEIHEANGVNVASIGSRTALSQLSLKGSHAYRLIVTGHPDGYASDYALGLYRLADNTACDPLASTAWDAPAITLGFPTRTEVTCRLLTATSGDRVRISTDTSDGVLEHEIYNTTGTQVCDSNYGGNLNVCQLTGTGPWRVVSYFHIGNNADPAQTAHVWINNHNLTTGCDTSVDLTVSMAAPRTTAERDGTTAVDCHVSAIARNNVVRVEVRHLTSDQLTWSLVDANGAGQCSGTSNQTAESCTLTGPAPYRVLVSGADGAPYELALRRITDPVGCTTISGVAVGIPTQTGSLTDAQDLRCYRFPGGAGDRVTLRATNANLEGTYYRVELYGPDGHLIDVKPTWYEAHTFNLTEPGDHVAIVSLDTAPTGTYRFSGTCENPACGPDQLNVVSVSPTRVGASQAVTIEIRGRALSQSTTVALLNGDQRIEGTVFDTSADSRSLQVSFNLADRIGTWDVEVATPDGAHATLADAVTVAGVRPPSVRAELIALNRFVAGRTQTISVVVENTGNVDALGTPLIIEGLPEGSVVTPQFAMVGPTSLDGPVAPSPFDADGMIYLKDDGTLGLPLYIGRIPAGGRTTYHFDVAVNTAVDYDLTVLTTDCLFDATVHSSARRLAATDDVDWEWGGGGCGDALIDAAIGGVGLIPGSDCVTFAADAAVAISRNVAQNSPPFSVSSPAEMFDSALSGLQCVVDFGPVGTVLSGLSFAADLINAGVKCFDGPQPQTVTSVASIDPNEIVGPSGGGEQRAIRGEGVHRYAIYFENDASATAPAQEVRITNLLDPAVYDLSTLRFSSVRFGTTNYTPPTDSSAIDDVLDLSRADGLRLDMRASVTPQGLVSWHLASQDPLTGTLPQDPFIGFLPPNQDGTEGQGVVFYDVELKDPANGDTIENVADIVFDLNEPIRTNTWSNLIDQDVPTASVTAPATTANSAIPVQWTGTDPTSGVDGIDVYVSVDGAPYELWQHDVAPGSATYSGAFGHRYAFSAVTHDHAGNASLLPPTPHATTTVQGKIMNTALPRISGKLRVGNTVKVSAGTWNPSAVTLAYQWYASGKKIVGAKGKSLRLSRRYKGKTISVKVTANKAGYRPATVTARTKGLVR